MPPEESFNQKLQKARNKQAAFQRRWHSQMKVIKIAVAGTIISMPFLFSYGYYPQFAFVVLAFVCIFFLYVFYLHGLCMETNRRMISFVLAAT